MIALARSRRPTLGASRLICIDGPAGSGKTTLASAIAAEAPEAATVHTDDLLAGWDGLAGLAGRLDPLLLPVAAGVPGSYERYDWPADRFADTVVVPPAPLLVLEGVGSGNRRHAALCTVLVWVAVDDDLRLARGLARDGEALRERWEQWMLDERAMFVDEDTEARADVIV